MNWSKLLHAIANVAERSPHIVVTAVRAVAHFIAEVEPEVVAVAGAVVPLIPGVGPVVAAVTKVAAEVGVVATAVDTAIAKK